MQNEMKFIPVGYEEVEPVLLCPVCGGSYVYPVSVACMPPGAHRGELIVRADGVCLNPMISPPIDDGVLITLRFWCAEAHTFTYALQFHKGQTYLERRTQAPSICEPVIWSA